MFSAFRHLAVAATLLAASASQAQDMPSNAHAYLNAQPGSIIGQELSAPVTWHQGNDGAFSSFGRASDGVTVRFQDGALNWLFQFGAPGVDAALRVGRYDNAGLFGSAAPGQAGLLISSPFGMMLEGSGWFDVLDIGYAANGSLDRFAVDFRQYDRASQSGPSVFGSLRYNISLAQPQQGANVPEPASVALMLAALALLAARGRRPRGRQD